MQYFDWSETSQPENSDRAKICLAVQHGRPLSKHDFEPWFKFFYGAKPMWPRVMDCAKDWMGNTRKQIKRQLTRLEEFQRKGKLKQNRKHKKTPPETKRKPRSATQQWLNGRQSLWRDGMAVTKTIVFQTAPCSSSFVLSVRFVP